MTVRLKKSEFEELLKDFKGFEAESGHAIISDAKQEAQKLLHKKSELTRLVTLIDLTTLAGDDTREKVQSLVDKALRPLRKCEDVRCAAVCVYPARVVDVVERLKSSSETRLKIASVAAGFPSGQYHLQSRLLEIELTIADGADEIDVVINRPLALNGNWNGVFAELKEMREKCGKSAHLKVILAVGELKSYDLVYKASWAAMLAGADFIKTSTGKETVNATLEYAFVMLSAIRNYFAFSQRRVGFKTAGGIRDATTALQYRCLVESVLGTEWLSPDLFRIGASSLLDDIIGNLENL